MLGWFFDLGIGNGLRNKAAEPLAKNTSGEARNYISFAYSLIAVIAVVIWLLFLCSVS